MPITDQLSAFVSDREGFSWRAGAQPGFFELTSGLWMGRTWQHAIVVVEPGTKRSENTAVLCITGGDVNDLDLGEARQIAHRSGVPVAMLFHIPNQPLFGDKWEDDLIAHTFDLYIETGDPTWPLLFPMTRAAIRCMDLLQELGYERFVITGASKRGWTTWLSAATGDPRIAGIAPMVIDNLNFPAQMRHQVESWGGYSEQIQDYTSRELQDKMSSERGAELTAMMDPISYISKITCPILVVNGTNDRYWTVDALSLYWDLLPPTKRCLIVPNVGHILGDKKRMVETVSAFAAACAQGDLLPEVKVLYREDGSIGEVQVHPPPPFEGAPGAIQINYWAATSATLDFRDSTWSTQEPKNGGFAVSDLNVAVMVEARFWGMRRWGGEFSLSAPVKVIKAAPHRTPNTSSTSNR